MTSRAVPDVLARSVAEILNEALPLWAEVSDTRPGSSTYRIRPLVGSWTQSDLELRQALDDLNESRIVDSTGTTTILLLRGMIEDLLRDAKISLGRLIRDPSAHATIERVGHLVDLASAPACIAAVEEARRGHGSALAAYFPRAEGHDGKDDGKNAVEQFLTDDHALGNVRLVAARSIETLRTHQMTRGRRSGRRLQLNQFVHVFDAPSYFLGAIERTLDASVSLALIEPGGRRTPYFAIGVRDGEVLHLLTDVERSVHPDFHAMTRRPDREIERRARRHLLPYRLLEDATVRCGTPESSASDLVPALSARVLCHLSLLSPAELTWLLMVADRIADRSGAGDLDLPELSYLGDAIHAASARHLRGNRGQVGEIGEAGLNRGPGDLGALSPVGVGDLGTIAGMATSAIERLVDVTRAGATPEAAETEVMVGYNAWLEARYRDRVPHAAVDVLSPPRVERARRALSRGVVHDDLDALFHGPAIGDMAIVSERSGADLGVDASADAGEDADLDWGVDEASGEARQIALRALPSDLIGSIAEVRADAHWCARKNIARVVSALARADFLRDRDAVIDWYTSRVAGNPEIERAIGHGSWVLPSCAYVSKIPRGESFPRPDRLVWEHRECLRTYVRKGKWTYPVEGDPIRTMEGVSESKLVLGWDVYCLLGGKGADGVLCRGCEGRRSRVASVVFEVRPDNYRALAVLAGVAEAELPWQLQHWIVSEPYFGNNILNRIDPIEEVTDPWNEIGLTVVVGLCHPCLAAIRKRHGGDRVQRPLEG